MPHGAVSLARLAWVSAVDLPYPAPATTAMTGTSNRTASASTKRVRASSPRSGEGGNGARRPLDDCCRLIGRERICGGHARSFGSGTRTRVLGSGRSCLFFTLRSVETNA
jgi:hypothetical protein